MSIGMIFFAVMIVLFIGTLLAPTIYKIMNPQEKRFAKQSLDLINKSDSKIECTVKDHTLTYTYDIHSCTYTKVTLERKFVDGRYDNSHQFCGTVEEAIENRLNDLNRHNLEKEPLVTRA